MELRVLSPADLEYFYHLMTEEIYRQAKEPDCLALGCLMPDLEGQMIPAGILAVRLLDGQLDVFWLLVEGAFRRQGIGRALVGHLVDYGIWIEEILGVAALFPAGPGSESLQAFFSALQFELIKAEAGLYSFTVGALAQLPDLARYGDGKYRVSSLSALPQYQVNGLNLALRERQADLVHLPVRPVDFDPDSCVCLDGEKVMAVLLLRTGPNEVEIPFLYAAPGAPKALPMLISEVAQRVCRRFDAATPVNAAAVNDKAAALLKKLLPVAAEEEIWFAAYEFAEEAEEAFADEKALA